MVWFVLYWPVMGGLSFLAHRIAKRYLADSIQRSRAELVRGFGIMARPIVLVPLIVFAASMMLSGHFGEMN